MHQAGRYYGSILGAVTAESSKGKPQLAIKFNMYAILSGAEFVGLEREFEKTVFLSLSDGAWPYSKPKLEAMGFNGNFDAPEFTESIHEVECRHDTFEGKPTERWELVGAGGFTPKEAASDVKKKLNRLWRSEAAGSAPVPPGKPAAPPKPTARQPKPSPVPAAAAADSSECEGGDGIPF